MTESRFRVPHTLVLLFSMVIVAQLLTWILPQGEFQRRVNEDGREEVVAGTYAHIEDGAWFNSIAHGDVDPRIDGTELYLKAGASLDFETNPVLDVTVEVDDAALAPDPNDTAALAINVTDVNEPPTVALANTTTTFPETSRPW